MCFKLGQLSGISIVDKERPISYPAVLLLLLLLLMLMLMLLLLLLLLAAAVSGVCFKLGQLCGISIVDKERPFSYAAVLLLLLLQLMLLLLLLLLFLLAVVVCVLN